jgi:phosphoglycerol transferase MdoB-like AlkP superfamily enzyme
MYFVRVVHLFKAFFLLLLVFLGLRAAFLAWNWQLFSHESSLALFFAFVHGLRFDAAILALLLGPLLVFNMIPPLQRLRCSRWWQNSERMWLMLCAILCLTPNISDIEHFHYIGRRATIEMFLNPTDFVTLLLPILAQHWYLVLAWVITCFLLSKALWIIAEHEAATCLSLRSWFALVLITVPLVTLLGRGGLQKRPLNSAHAITTSPSPQLAALSLNSTYTLLRSIGNNRIAEVVFFKPEDNIFSYLRAQQHFANLPRRTDNVIILIMESLGAEFLSELNEGESRIPFIESLGRTKGLLLVNCLANGGETGYAHNSILASIPQMMPTSIIGTVYENNEIIGLGSILKKYAYATSFYHGGPRGLFNFDIRARTLGFDEHFYKEDYPDQSDYDGQWGIYDEPFFAYAAEKLKAEATPPFASYILSLSNHPPYRLPASYTRPNFPHWSPKEHTAYYADQAVKKFFASIEHEPWFKDTLFVITGDHPPFELADKMREHPLDRRRIPLIFYHPRGLPLQGVSLKLAQQTDILPSILDFLGLGSLEQKNITPFGRSVFSPQDGLAVLYNFGSFDLFAGHTLVTLKGDHSLVQQTLAPTSIPLPPDSSTAVDYGKLLKGYVQYYTSGLINNRFYPERHPSG